MIVDCQKCQRTSEWFKKMIQCWRCYSWYHDDCININHPLFVFGDRFWRYQCRLCGEEELCKIDMEWKDIAHLILFNLWHIHGYKHHDVVDVIEFLRKNIERFESKLVEDQDPSTWHGKFTEVFSSHPDIFICGKEQKKRSSLWGLKQFKPPTVDSNGQKKQNSSEVKRKCSDEDNKELRGTGAVVSQKFLELQQKKKVKTEPKANNQTTTTDQVYSHLPTPPPEPSISIDYSKRKRGRKPKEYYEQVNTQRPKSNADQLSPVTDIRMKGRCISTTSVFEKNVIDNTIKLTLKYDRLQMSMSNIFGPVDRLKNGQTFTVHAKRVNENNQVEYLIEWHDD